jgi:hypothetical protein
MTEIGQVYQPALSKEFADFLRKQGRKIKTVSDALDVMKWHLADAVNLEWIDGGYKGEVTKEEFYIECCTCLPVMLFGKSGQTLRRWCDLRNFYEDVPNSDVLLRGSSFDHLLRAKRLELGNKIEAAEIAVAVAIKNELTAEEMQYKYDPRGESETEERTIERLFSLADAMWIPREAASLILQAVKIIREYRKQTV